MVINTQPWLFLLVAINTADHKAVPLIIGIRAWSDCSGFIAIKSDTEGSIIVLRGTSPNTSIDIAIGTFIVIEVARPDEIIWVGAPVVVATSGAAVNMVV